MSKRTKAPLVKRLQAAVERAVHPLPATLACLVAVTGTGIIAVRLGSLDQGRVVTIEEAGRATEVQRKRILDDPRMPARAKEMALRYMGAAVRSAPPPPSAAAPAPGPTP